MNLGSAIVLALLIVAAVIAVAVAYGNSWKTF